MTKLTIDNREFEIESLEDDAKAQLASIQAVDKRIVALREDLAIMQTARANYANALRELLPEQEEVSEE
ncbi:hypothetical protein [Parasphingorhabdus sp.]|uniref:hypothetical protein n=1 Tax=Parasphingorhabdus sp. TaxID=2709688 RepID=UPI0030020583